MPKLVLVNPPNHRHDTQYLAPPLGLLVLSDIARSCGWAPSILDFDLPRHRALADNPERFYALAAQMILEQDPDLVGFTSMGVNCHVSILIAERLRAEGFIAPIIAGGPFFSSLRHKLPGITSAIDRVIPGEAESEFSKYLSDLRPNHDTEKWEQLGHPSRHPFESYSQVNLQEYFSSNQRRLLHYEAGRGCVYRCSFCYSPAHYQGVSFPEPNQVADDFRRLSEIGAGHLFIVNDNFLNDPRRALGICRAITRAGTELTWNCYVTLPQLSPDLTEALGQAGCRSVYCGIDAVSLQAQTSFNKRFFRSHTELFQKIEALLSAGIRPTCAFIFNIAADSHENISLALQLAADCAAHGAAIRLNALCRYPGSPIADDARSMHYSPARTKILLDCPKVVQANPFAAKHPALFPFHAHDCGSESAWIAGLRKLWIAQRLIGDYPEQLRVLVGASTVGWSELFEALSQPTLNVVQKFYQQEELSV